MKHFKDQLPQTFLSQIQNYISHHHPGYAILEFLDFSKETLLDISEKPLEVLTTEDITAAAWVRLGLRMIFQ